MVSKFWSTLLTQNSLGDYLAAVAGLGVGILVIESVRRLIRHRRGLIANSAPKVVMGRLGNRMLGVAYLVLVIFCLQQLDFTPKFAQLLKLLMGWGTGILAIQAITQALVEYGDLRNSQSRRPRSHGLGDFRIVAGIFRMVIWVFGLSLLADNLGVNVTPVLAGLGIGGVAVALAAQTLLKDFLSYIVIRFDRPFQEGDFIAVGEFSGTVEYIGLKTTRIRSVSGEEVVFVNSGLCESRIKNYQNMQQRRVHFKLGVVYETPWNKLALIPQDLAQLIRKTEGVTGERVHLWGIEDGCFLFEIAYYVSDRDYVKSLEVRQAVNLAILEYLDSQQIQLVQRRWLLSS